MDEADLLAAMDEVDSYRLVRVLAEGPVGRTELVRQDGGPLCVRKRMPLGLASEGAWRAAATCREPHLPRVEGVWRMPDELVVVYRYVEGPTLERVVAVGGPLPEGRALSLLQDLCLAAAALHEAGVVHRDITPGNVVVAVDGAHLIDLGIARLHEEGRSRDTTTLGTVGFAAPEQFGFAQTDARSDVYALGRVLAFMLTARSPQAADATAGLVETGASEATVGLVARACAFEPSARFQGARELAEAARAAARGLGGPDAPAAAEEARTARPDAWTPRPDAWHWLVAVALVPEVVRALVTRSAASRGRRVGAAALLALGMAMGSFFAWSGVQDLLAAPGLETGFEAPALCCVGLWWCLLPSVEAGAFVLGCGGYQRGLRGRASRLALALLQDALAGFGLALALAVVLVGIQAAAGA